MEGAVFFPGVGWQGAGWVDFYRLSFCVFILLFFGFRCTSISCWPHICACSIPLQYSSSSNHSRLCGHFSSTSYVEVNRTTGLVSLALPVFSQPIQVCYEILAFQDPLVGGGLLLAYTTGYVAPLLLAASFAGALQVCCIPTFLYIHNHEGILFTKY